MTSINSFLAMPAEHVYVPIMPPLMTAEDLLKPGVPERADLVRGVLVVHEPPGFRQGEITVRLTIALGTYVDTRHLGRVVAGDAGFKLQSDPDTVRGADIAFVSWERLPRRSCSRGAACCAPTALSHRLIRIDHNATGVPRRTR